MPNETPSNEPVCSSTDYRAIRIANLESLKGLGYKPYGRAFERTATLAQIRADFTEGRPVSVAGRITTVRRMGKALFADIHDGSDRFQVFVSKQEIGEDAFKAMKYLDLGDFIGLKGELFLTKTGEPTVRANHWELLTKAILQPPEKWHGLQDIEDRYRRRYLDLMSNPESRLRFNQRHTILAEIRQWLQSRGFVEVETPMMQAQPGGAAAKPFVTHHNALNTPMYMRIAPELYLKRLLVGGFDKIFELGKDFRNEGIDRTHNPEFTVLEIYEAYGDRLSMKTIIEGMLPHLCEKINGKLEFEYGANKEIISFKPPFREVPYKDLVREFMGDDWFDKPLNEKVLAAREKGLDIDPTWDDLLVTHEVYDKLIEKTLRQPTFVTRIPRQFVPLAKACEDDPELVDVFEFVVAGKELCPGYTEQNDPFQQREALACQAMDDPEKLDEDFICALEHGMPPTGGLGIGIDRLVMLLTNTEVIRDVILFPQMKAEAK